ncbi:hypothetical protein D3C77_115580 [compost metagenome]
MEAALVANLLMEGGIHLEGIGLSDEDIVQKVSTGKRTRPFCVVRNWLLLDVMLPSDVEDEVRDQHLHPTVVFARMVAYDSRVEEPRPGSIRSSFQHSLQDWVFRSKETDFLLAGPGVRKHVSLPALLALDNL